MQGKRSLRVGELLHQEISHILSRDMKDPRLSSLTVTRVDLTDDLKHARVYVSVFGRGLYSNEIVPALEGATGFIRGRLGKTLKLKWIPQLIFQVDESVEYSLKISKMLKDLGVDDL